MKRSDISSIASNYNSNLLATGYTGGEIDLYVLNEHHYLCELPTPNFLSVQYLTFLNNYLIAL